MPNTDRSVDLVLERPGNFDFYLHCRPSYEQWKVLGFQPSTVGDVPDEVCHFVILVEPVLRIGDKDLQLDALCIQSHLPPCMGRIDEWWDVLKVASYSGFNVIHLCPPQVLEGRGEVVKGV